MGTSVGSRARRVMMASALVLGVGVLAACTPKPAPPAPIAPAPPAPTARLSITPTSAPITTEATYGAGTLGDFTVTNTGNATSGPVAIDLSGLLNGLMSYRVSFDLCTGNTLAPGASCFFQVAPTALQYTTGTTGPANFTVTAGAGVAVQASVTGTLTSDLILDSSVTPLFLTAPATPGTDAKPFNLVNDSNHSIGPLDFTLHPDTDPLAVGTWSLVAPGTGTPCTAGMTLAAHTSCSWSLTYTNATGAGGSSVIVAVDGDAGDAAHATGVAFGAGTP